MEILSTQINNFKVINQIISRNISFIVDIKNKLYFAKITFLINNKHKFDRITKTNQNILKIYNKLIPKNIVIPLEKHNIFIYENTLYQFILTRKVDCDLGNLKNKDIDFYKNITNQVLNILYELLEERIIYFDVKIHNFLIDNNKVYITDFEDDYIKLLIWEDKQLIKTIFTLQFYLFYISFRSYYPDYSFFKEIRFFGMKEKILEFFLKEKFYDYLFEYLINNYCIFINIINKYLDNLNQRNSYDEFFIHKLKEKNYLKKNIV